MTQTAACAHSQTLWALSTRTHRQVLGEWTPWLPRTGRARGCHSSRERLAGSTVLQGLTPQNPASLLYSSDTHMHTLKWWFQKHGAWGYFYSFFYTTNSNSKKHFKNETTLPSKLNYWRHSRLSAYTPPVPRAPAETPMCYSIHSSFSHTYTAIKTDTTLIPWYKYLVLPEFVSVFTFNQELKAWKQYKPQKYTPHIQTAWLNAANRDVLNTNSSAFILFQLLNVCIMMTYFN